MLRSLLQHGDMDHIEELFTLGLFQDAYKAGEALMFKILAERTLPRSLLLPCIDLAKKPSASPTASSHLSNSSNSKASLLDQSLGSTVSNSSATSRSSSSSTRRAGTSGNSLSLGDSYAAEVGLSELSSSGHATSSAPYKVRELSYDTLPEPDKLKLKALVQDTVPILVIMVQCLFELNLKPQIVPFLQLLCGSKYEEYPFELAYLVINLLVTTKEIEKARKVSETVLSSLRSQLGPMPIKSYSHKSESSPISTSDHPSPDISPSSPTKASSSSSSDSQASMTGFSAEDDPYDLDEDEATIIRRQHFESLLQLYIFYILCPLHLFADAKSYLFIEARLHPKLVQQWIYYVDELEGAHLEENKRQEEIKRSQQLSNDTRGSPILSSAINSRNSHDTPRHSSNSWWDAFIEEDSESQSGSDLTSSLSTQSQAKSKPFYFFILKKIILFLKSASIRYQKLPEAFKTALKVFVALATMALTYVIANSKRLKYLSHSKWNPFKSRSRNHVIALSSQSDSRLLSSRGLLGSQSAPRYR